jgi:hypothetical protein
MWWILGIPSICAVCVCFYVTFLYTQTNCTYDDLFWWVPEWIPLRWILGEDENYRMKYRFKTRGWLLQKWDNIYSKYIEPLLHVIGIGIFLVLSPALIVFVFLYLFYCGWQFLWDLLKTRAMLPILFAFFGLFFGVFGWQGALAGMAIGFILGVLIECIKINDLDHKPTTSKPYLTGFQNKAVEKETTVTPIYNAYYHERPWVWKGWQIESGPKEDSLRKDL